MKEITSVGETKQASIPSTSKKTKKKDSGGFDKHRKFEEKVEVDPGANKGEFYKITSQNKVAAINDVDKHEVKYEGCKSERKNDQENSGETSKVNGDSLGQEKVCDAKETFKMNDADGKTASGEANGVNDVEKKIKTVKDDQNNNRSCTNDDDKESYNADKTEKEVVEKNDSSNMVLENRIDQKMINEKKDEQQSKIDSDTTTKPMEFIPVVQECLVIPQSAETLSDAILIKKDNTITGFVQGVLSRAICQLQMEDNLDQDTAYKKKSTEDFKEGRLPAQSMHSETKNVAAKFEKSVVISQSVEDRNKTKLMEEEDLVAGFVQGVLSQAIHQLQVEEKQDQGIVCKTTASFEETSPAAKSMNLDMDHVVAKTAKVDKGSVISQSHGTTNNTDLVDDHFISDYVQGILSQAILKLQMEDKHDQNVVCEKTSTGHFQERIGHAESMNLNTGYVVAKEDAKAKENNGEGDKEVEEVKNVNDDKDDKVSKHDDNVKEVEGNVGDVIHGCEEGSEVEPVEVLTHDNVEFEEIVVEEGVVEESVIENSVIEESVTDTLPRSF